MGALLPLVCLEGKGRALLADGTLVSAFEVQPLNTLVLDEERVTQLAGQVHKLLSRVPTDQTLSLYVQSRPLDAEQLVDADQHLVERAARVHARARRRALAQATLRLGWAQAHSLRTHVPALPASNSRYFVICPLRPARGHRPVRRGAGVAQLTASQLAATSAEHDRYVNGVLSGLKAMRLQARPLAGVELADMLWERCSPDLADAGAAAPSEQPTPPVDGLSRARTAEEAVAFNARLLGTLCQQQLDSSARGHLRWDRSVEQVVRLGSVPEETWLGWMQYLSLSSLPFTLAVHFRGRDRFRERTQQTRRYRQLWAQNRGHERMGRFVGPDRDEAEDEAREVAAGLKRQAASTVYDVSAYLAVRDPGGDPQRLVDEVRNVARELTGATDAVVNETPFAQIPLWRATLPLGIDPPRRSRKYLSVNAADSWPLIGAGCGSPPSGTAIALGYAQPGRELVRVDPYDPEHPNHVTVITAQSGGGKTVIANLLAGRVIANGGRGAIIDRSGHYDFLASLIPGAASVRIGGADGEHRINPWDGTPTAEKVAFLVALHELILTDGQGASSLGKLGESLLGLAIRAVYRRCEQTGEIPRETLLQEELVRRHRDARDDGATELAGVLQVLAESLHNYVGAGPHAWLCDHDTTVQVDAPLVVYDTRRLPDSEAPAALFVICEAIIRRVEAARERFLANPTRAPWAGKYFLIFEEVWKLIGHSATGRWVNELARRSRHLALWLIAISQQLDDFRGPQAEALISQSSLRIVLRQHPSRLAFLREQLGLTAAAIEQIVELTTVKREYSQAYVQNGTRGEGVVTIALGALEYWRCTSDPVGDEPLRRRALRETGGTSWRHAWAALKLLLDPDWHARIADEDRR